jgi:hypothetical protein
MLRHVLATGVLTCAVLVPTCAWVQDLTVLKSESVDLPLSDRQFEGPGADAINNNCLACHSADMVLNQPTLSKATWEAEVHKMINVYKAPVAEEDIAPIVAYLAKIRGAD